MARIRTMKPEFWQDEKLSPEPPVVRLVFLGLVSQADDAGRLIDSTKLLDGLLFPFTDETCGPSLDRLAQLGVIERGVTEGGQRVIQVAGWEKHQKVDHPNTKAALPPIREGLARDSRETRAPYQRPTTNDQRPASGAHARTRGEPRAAGREPGESLDPSRPWDGLDPLVAASIRGLYGGPDREGTDEAVWRDANGVDRERVLATAVLRWRGESHAQFNQRLFRKIVLAVIEEQSTNQHDTSHWEEPDAA